MSPRREHYGCQDAGGGPPPEPATVLVDAFDARPGTLSQKIVWDPLAFRTRIDPYYETNNELWYIGLTNTPSLPPEAAKGNFTGAADLSATEINLSLTLTGNSTLTIRGIVGYRAQWLQLKVTQGAGGSKTLALLMEDPAGGIRTVKTPGGVPLALSTAAGAVDIVKVYWDGFIAVYAWIKGKRFA